jgi:hypothetical protein
MVDGSDADGIDFPYNMSDEEYNRAPVDRPLPNELTEFEQAITRSRVTMTYDFPNEDPKYFQELVEYIVEADHERNIPIDFGAFIEDFVMWMKNGD